MPEALRAFLRSEATGGIVLATAAALALIAANSPLSNIYFAAVHADLGAMTVQHWINDLLMAVFFLVVGLEIKREWFGGHLSAWADRRLPVIAATAGMIVPALIYLAVSRGDPALARGWAVPAATDIAFALGVLALLGRRAPASLRLFLTTVAIVDDIGAVAIIALFYTTTLGLAALAAAVAIWLAMFALNKARVQALWPYLVMAGALWFAVLHSGVHATVAGVLAAFAIPTHEDEKASPLHRLEQGFAWPVGFLIVPLFGFANAGVSLSGVGLEELASPLVLGIALGLFLGKQIGIFGSVWAAIRLGLAHRPADAGLRQLYGVALLCGIGFTMSLFIGGLAFGDPAMADAVKIGVLLGSAISALAGYAVLRFFSSPPDATPRG